MSEIEDISRRQIRNMIVHGRPANENFISRKNITPLNSKEMDKICSYLENPTKIGIWTLKIKWDNGGGITKFIRDKILPILNKGTIEIRDKKIKIKDDDKYHFLEATGKFTFIFSLFVYLISLEKKEDNNFSDYEKITEDYKFMFDILDLEEIKREYIDAFNYFKDNIYFENFNPVVHFNQILKIKDGTFIINEQRPEKRTRYDIYDEYFREERRIPDTNFTNRYFIAIESEPLEKLRDFFSKVGKFTDPVLMPLHSPEDEVFMPYFLFLEQTYYHFIDNRSIIDRFEKAISEYKIDDYYHCVNTVGLIVEDYLIQIYETFFTETCPKDLGMGQIFGLINSSTNNKFKKPLDKAPEIKLLYDKIDTLVKEQNKPEFNEKILNLFRDVLTYLKVDEKYVLGIINVDKDKDNMKSVFPKELISNIKEVIKNRNATSHKSTDPIRSYEALRTVYGCITLIMWWNAEKRLIAWKEVPDERLRKSVERNSNLKLS